MLISVTTYFLNGEIVFCNLVFISNNSVIFVFSYKFGEVDPSARLSKLIVVVELVLVVNLNVSVVTGSETAYNLF